MKINKLVKGIVDQHSYTFSEYVQLKTQPMQLIFRLVFCFVAIFVSIISNTILPDNVAYADDFTSTVVGRLINKSVDHGTVADIPIFLHKIEDENTESLEAVTDLDGRFMFEDVHIFSQAVYGLTTVYQGAFYAVEFTSAEWTSSPIEIVVYDSVADDSFISVDSISILFEGVDENASHIHVMEMVTLSNSNDRTYIPGPGVMDLLRFGLPEGASGFRLETELLSIDHIKVDRGFALVGSVPPGRHELLYSYHFPFSSSSINFDKTLRYGSQRTRVLVPIGVMGISSDQIEITDRFKIGSLEYEVLESGESPKGTAFSIQLSDLPVNSRFLDWYKGVRLEYAALASLGLLMTIVFATAIWAHTKKEDY